MLYLAVTCMFAVRVRVQVNPVPVQEPDQPPKLDPDAGAAVRVTCVPVVKLALQTVPQLIPAGLLVVVPLPVPAGVTVNAAEVTCELNVAVTEVFVVKVSTQVAVVPEHAPPQPANVELGPAAAVRVTFASRVKFALQVVPQLIPAGLLVTVPVPVPARATVKANGGGVTVLGLNIAVTVVVAVRSTVHVPVPEQAPCHPANTEFDPGVAVRVTSVCVGNSAEQTLPQLMPEGVLLTVPPPVPPTFTIN